MNEAKLLGLANLIGGYVAEHGKVAPEYSTEAQNINTLARSINEEKS